MSPAAEETAPSPCIGICRMHEGRSVCEGCWRTLAEIAEWGGAPERRRREILRAVRARREAEIASGRDDAS